MEKLGETGLFLLGVSVAVLTLKTILDDVYDRSRDLCRGPAEDWEPFEFDELSEL